MDNKDYDTNNRYCQSRGNIYDDNSKNRKIKMQEKPQ